MIELTRKQVLALEQVGQQPATVIDPTTQTAFVLLRQEVYERLTKDEYDASPWTDGEWDALAVEVDAMLDDDMAIEDESCP